MIPDNQYSLIIALKNATVKRLRVIEWSRQVLTLLLLSATLSTGSGPGDLQLNSAQIVYAAGGLIIGSGAALLVAVAGSSSGRVKAVADDCGCRREEGGASKEMDENVGNGGTWIV